MLLSRGLDFNNLPGSCHDEVQIDFGVRVLLITEIEKDVAFNNSYTDGSNKVADGGGGQCAGFHQFLHGETESHECSRDGGGACTAVRLNDIAVESNGAFTHL